MNIVKVLPIRVLHSRLVSDKGQARDPRGSGPASVEAARRLRSWGSQKDLADENETAEALSRSSSADSITLAHDAEARDVVSSARDECPMLELFASEEVMCSASGSRNTSHTRRCCL